MSEDIPQKFVDESEELEAIFKIQLRLLSHQSEENELREIKLAPIFTGAICNQIQSPSPMANIHGDLPISTQYGLLGGDAGMLAANQENKVDPRIFHNVSAPSSIFICGSQGSGKSHTLSCLLENCLIPSAAGVLPKPLTGVVFHFDTFSSDTGGSPCEAAYLSSSLHVRVRVLCAPTNIQAIKKIYSKLSNVSVEELLINDFDLNTKRMLDLMGANGGDMPLYLHVVNRVLREMRIEQQRDGYPFSYTTFKKRMEEESLTPAQLAPFIQRLDTLESFMPKQQTGRSVTGKKIKKSTSGNDWNVKAGQLTIVDLSCPCVTPEMACSLFSICLSLFLEHDGGIGRIVALDEAHKYMNDSPGSQALTNGLMETIRLQRHLGARVIISTQEPTISPMLLDLCSITIVHRFTSPDWLRSLKEHLAGVSSASRLQQSAIGAQNQRCVKLQTIRVDSADPMMELFSIIVRLNVGEALLFAPSAIVGYESLSVNGTSRPVVERLENGILKVRIRSRITADGGRSVLAD